MPLLLSLHFIASLDGICFLVLLISSQTLNLEELTHGQVVLASLRQAPRSSYRIYQCNLRKLSFVFQFSLRIMRLQSQWPSQFHLAWIARVSRSCTCNRNLTGAWQFGARIRTFKSSLQAFHLWSLWISSWNIFFENLICATYLAWPTHCPLWLPQKCCLYHRIAACSFARIGPSVLSIYYWSSVSQFLSPIVDLIVPFPPAHWIIAYSILFKVEARSRGCPLADVCNLLLSYASKLTLLSP